MRTQAIAAVLGAAAALAGCATTEVDAQWRNIDTPAGYLRGATVLVGCEGADEVLRRLCTEQVSADLAARGALPVLAAPGTVEAMQPGFADQRYLPAARERGARAVFVMTLGVASQRVSQGMTVGIGGFGFGRHVGGGVGVAAPIGGGEVSAGYAANARVTDVATGRLMWTARASAPPSGDLTGQLAELSKQTLAAAAGAGLF